MTTSPRLPVDRLAAFDVACRSALRDIDPAAWEPEPTLPGGFYGEVELTQPGAMPTEELR